MHKIKKYLVLLVIITIFLLFTSQQTPSNNVNGFSAAPGSFEILSNYQGKSNVLKVNRSKTDWYIARYSLSQYRGKEIFIEFSVEVRCEGSSGSLGWLINNSNYPAISWIDNVSSGQWQTMKGKMIIIPTSNDPILFFSSGEMPSNTTVYIANPVITITEGNPLTPDLSLKPLKEIYANDFLIGQISSHNGLYLTGKYLDIFKHHYNRVTFNAVYPHMIIPKTKGAAYDFTNADNILNIAVRNNIQVYGHPLVYHGDSGEPDWMFEGTREDIIQNMNNHITTMLRHFRGRINTWEVVNEALKRDVSSAEARGDWKRCVVSSHNSTWTDNHWFNKLGADYIELAFRAARAADPNITLYINDDFQDVNMAEVGRKMILDINNRYKKETGENRNLIEGVGIQIHPHGLNYNVNNLRSIIQKFTDLGIEIVISELDVSTVGHARGEGNDTVISERDAMTQALIYARLFSLFREFSAHIKSVTFWDIDDGNSWLSAGNPTLFDFRLNAKPAFFAVSDPDSFIRQHGGRTRR